MDGLMDGRMIISELTLRLRATDQYMRHDVHCARVLARAMDRSVLIMIELSQLVQPAMVEDELDRLNAFIRRR
jgi:hypothetical protein